MLLGLESTATDQSSSNTEKSQTESPNNHLCLFENVSFLCSGIKGLRTHLALFQVASLLSVCLLTTKSSLPKFLWQSQGKLFFAAKQAVYLGHPLWSLMSRIYSVCYYFIRYTDLTLMKFNTSVSHEILMSYRGVSVMWPSFLDINEVYTKY